MKFGNANIYMKARPHVHACVQLFLDLLLVPCHLELASLTEQINSHLPMNVNLFTFDYASFKKRKISEGNMYIVCPKLIDK